MASNNLFATLKDGSKFPKVAFGTGTSFMSDPSGVTQSAVAAWDVGYRHFDTAKMYGTEGLLGEAINIILAKEGVQRSDLFVTSKIQPHVHKYEDVRKRDQIWFSLFSLTFCQMIPLISCKVVDHVNDTLDKLQLTYIDIMMLHGPGPVFDGGFSKRFCSEEEYKHLPRTPEEIHEGRMASWRALQDLKKEGKIKNIGVSNFSKKHLEALANDDR